MKIYVVMADGADGDSVVDSFWLSKDNADMYVVEMNNVNARKYLRNRNYYYVEEHDVRE